MHFCVCGGFYKGEKILIFEEKKKVLNVNKSMVGLLMITASHYCSVLSIKSLVNNYFLGTGNQSVVGICFLVADYISWNCFHFFTQQCHKLFWNMNKTYSGTYVLSTYPSFFIPSHD